MNYWFPFNFSLQNLTPPLSLQRRFISFILKRSLGHLLKPGQLDVEQIDAQIGNGFVEVKDLELDNTAINQHLNDLPIALLHGSISKVTTRIPWPNPFSSAIGLSMSSLHLFFEISECMAEHAEGDYLNGLAESLASVAESFVHEELTETEEASLGAAAKERPAAAVPRVAEQFVGPPGSLDPFLEQETEQELEQDVGLINADSDPEGVPIFASLFERLLSRFDFDASDIRITLKRKDGILLSVAVGNVRYETDKVTSRETTHISTERGEMRSLCIEDVKIEIGELLGSSVPLSASVDLVGIASPVATESGDSEIDEETQTMMSQSIISLPPPRAPLPTSQPASTIPTNSSLFTSSVYQSAISTSVFTATSKSKMLSNVRIDRHRERTLLAITDPIRICLRTPPPYVQSRQDALVGQGSLHDNRETTTENSQGKLKLSISIGIVAAALDARTLQQLLSLLDSLASVSVPTGSQAGHYQKAVSCPKNAVFDRLVLSASVKGFLALFLLPERVQSSERCDEIDLSQFFSKPLVPPPIPRGYFRVHLDEIRADYAGLALPAQSFDHVPASKSSVTEPSLISDPDPWPSTRASFSIADLSVLRFQRCGTDVASEEGLGSGYSSPVLLSDPNLLHSYPETDTSSFQFDPSAVLHSHPFSNEAKRSNLPYFKVVDWTPVRQEARGLGIGAWKTKARSRYSSQHQKLAMGASTSAFPENQSMAISARAEFKYSSLTAICCYSVALHAFIALDTMSLLADFLADALSQSAAPDSQSTEARPNVSRDSARQGRRRSSNSTYIADDALEELEFEEFGTNDPNVQDDTSCKTMKQSSAPAIHLEMNIPIARIEVRVPPPKGVRFRSGSLLFDIHSARISNGPLRSHIRSSDGRFVEPWDKHRLEDWLGDSYGRVTCICDMRRITVAYAGLNQLQAQGIVSLGPLCPPETESPEITSSLPFPLILHRSSASGGTHGKSSFLVRVPSAHIVMDKELLDGIQLWADDLSQWIELATGNRTAESTQANVGRTASLINSRYFTRRTDSESSDESSISFTDSKQKAEVIIKVVLCEGFIRLNIPVTEESRREKFRHLNIVASDLDSLIEIKPDGKDETVVSMGISSASVAEEHASRQHTIVQTDATSSREGGKYDALRLTYRSVNLPGTIAKESGIRLVTRGVGFDIDSDLNWIADLVVFLRAPPGAFETVIPSERTQIYAKILDCSLRTFSPSERNAMVLSLGEIGLLTDLIGNSKETTLDICVVAMSILLNDDIRLQRPSSNLHKDTGTDSWIARGYALLSTVEDLKVRLNYDADEHVPELQALIDGVRLSLYLCADSISEIAAFVSDIQTLFQPQLNQNKVPLEPKDTHKRFKISNLASSDVFRSLDEQAFRGQPVIGPLPDMIRDDLPSNPEYLDASFGAAGGLRALEDDDFYPEEPSIETPSKNIVSQHGTETVKILDQPIDIIEDYFDTLAPSIPDDASQHGETSLKVRAQDCNAQVFLYDGYDWERTKRIIRDEVKRVKRRLAKIRQLLASGQSYDSNVDDVGTMLFNSVYVGLDQDADDFEPDELLAAIDEELDESGETGSEGSWQSFKATTTRKTESRKGTLRAKPLDRAKEPSVEFCLRGASLKFDQYRPGSNLASCTLITVKDFNIIDHIKTSTWSKFLTDMRSDSRGNIRETDSDMLRVELQMLLPYRDCLEQEARLKAKLLPLRLHVDQDALDFLKKFFSFQGAEAQQPTAPEKEIFFQHVEIFPVDIKLDYKPRRVDYRALKEGRTIELMNFFHFDGAEMTLNHLTMTGITGWATMLEKLNELWTPDVKANQLVDVVSGVSPIRSAVNVGSGIADLVLLPIAQYKKDGRIIRGLQKGTTAFMKSTAMEAIRLGARLATGTQVVLERTEALLGGQFSEPITTEALQIVSRASDLDGGDGDRGELISKYAEQPTNLKEGVQTAYKTLSQNIRSAGQTILAVPMEVYERSGTEGPARAVIRAVPIAVLKPMIGASAAISQTLLGLHNTLDPQVQRDTEAKYKHR